QRQNVLSVPNGAVQREGQDRVLQVKQSDGTTAKVTVQVGLSDSTNTEIISGVEEGATVVIPGVTATNSSAAPTVAAGGFPGGGFRGNFSGGPPPGGD
ncbi:MAG: RND transporter, partial [Chloroflexi bacterium]|nr:RND transporter [Chloroflexota bacterium]